jgi:hypothetical protein
MEMFPAEIEDTPLHRRIVEFFGKKMLEEAADEGRREGRNEGRRLGLARLIVRHARRNHIAPSSSEDEAAATLAERADENTLLQMADALGEMNDFAPFVRRFGVDWPGPAEGPN